MIFKPWDCAQPDEWLPRSLRLCWGGDGGGGFGGDSGGGGFTGGGDWGSSGSYDASGFNAGGDLGAWAGTAYDASTAGTGAGAGGDWGSFGATNYSGMNAPNPTFADIAGPNPGVTTGGGDWGSAGAYSAAGMGGGDGGGLYGTGGGFYGGGPGGGLFGDYGGGGGYVGGGGGPFGGGGGGGGGGRGASSPSVSSPYADDTGPSGRGESEVSSPYADDTGPTGRGEQDTVGPAPEAAPEAAPAEPSDFGKPSEAAPEAAPEAATPEAEPASSATTSSHGRGIGSDEVASPSAFGPESITSQEGRQALSDLTQSALTAQEPSWGSVFEAPTDPGYQNDRSDLVGPVQADPGPFESLISDIPGVTTPAWAQDIGKSITDINTWLSPLNQQTFNEITNLPSTINQALNPSVPMMLQAPSTMDLQAVGEQGKAGQPQDTFDSRFGLDPNTDTTNWGSVFEAPAQAPDYASVFEAPAQEPDWASVFEGTPSSPDWTSVFEGAPSTAPDTTTTPTYDTTMESGQPVAPTTTDDTTTIGGDPALSGLSAADAAAAGTPGAPGAPGAPGQPGAPQAGGFVDPGASPDAAVNAASIAADKAGVSPEAADAVTQAVGSAQESGANPTAIATAAMAAALDRGATQEQADAIAAAVYDAAVSQAENVVGTTPGQQPQAPPGQQVTSSAFIPGGRETNFEYGPTQTQPQSLIEMAQPGTQAFIPGGRTTDFNYPSSTSRGIEPGAEQYGVEPEDHDAPEPADRSQPEVDPNAPRPPGSIPGQLLGANGTYQNQRADNPQVNRNYRDSGRTDYPQGRPGVNFISARQAGIEPLFRTEDINTRDLDFRLVERINRAMADMPANIRDGLTASSGWRPAHRGEAIEHGQDPRTSQESVYSRGHPSDGRGGFISAAPGGSNHGHGRAIDFLSSPALTWLRAHAGQYGLETIANDHPHIQLQGARGNVGPRPSAQQQAEQRAIDAQNRQAAIDQGLIGGGRGQAPTQQARPSAPMPGRPGGIGSDIAATAPTQPIMIGFKGLNGVFDEQAFNDHAAQMGYAPVTVNSVQEARAILDAATGRVGLYGFSKGASTAHGLLGEKGVKDKVDRVVTVAPFHSQQTQNFKGTNWDNYPDYSSRGIAPAGQGFNIQTRQHSKEAQREAAAGQPAPPPEVPVARPPPEAPLPPDVPVTRPQADIPINIPAPAPFMAPPARGPADRAMLERTADYIGREASKGLTKASGQPEFTAAANNAAQAMAKAGIPANVARDVMLTGAMKGLHDPARGNYKPTDLTYGLAVKAINDTINAALQGYHPAAPGPVQGPYGFQPDAPTVAARAKGGPVEEDQPYLVGEEGPEYFVPDQPGTVYPHIPQPGKAAKTGRNIDRWPKIPAPEFPGRYGGVEREMLRQTREAQYAVPTLMDMIDSGRMRLNAANWHAMLNDPALIALGRSRMDDRREGLDPGAEQYGAFIPAPAPAAEPPDPANPMAQALGYSSIKRRPMQIGRQSYQ